MTISISPSLSRFDYAWADWKTTIAARSAVGRQRYALQAATDPDTGTDASSYFIYFYDGQEIHVCAPIYTGTVPQAVQPAYSQTQNDSDKSDFETNYKPAANPILQRVANDGRVQQVFTITKTCTNFSLRAFKFQLGDPTSLACAHGGYLGSTVTMTDITYKCFDSSGTDVTSSPSTAVVSQLDLEPTFGAEILGGWLDVPDATHSAIVTAGAGLYIVSATGCPDIPSSYGGSVPFVYEVDLALRNTYSPSVVSDGMATQYLKPTVIGGVNYNTNKLRWTFKHPSGVSPFWFQGFVRTFV